MVASHLKNQGTGLFFGWMALIYLKLHLKDSRLKMNRDECFPSGTIGELHDWSQLHHVHCLARTPYTNAIIEPGVRGSVILLPAKQDGPPHGFDFRSDSQSRTMALTLGDIYLVACMDDAALTVQARLEQLRRVTALRANMTETLLIP